MIVRVCKIKDTNKQKPFGFYVFDANTREEIAEEWFFTNKERFLAITKFRRTHS